MAEMVKGCVLYMKKVLRKIKIVHDVRPRTHARNVITGSVGSSVSGTTSATSSTGHLSSVGGSPSSFSAAAAAPGVPLEFIKAAVFFELERMRQMILIISYRSKLVDHFYRLEHQEEDLKKKKEADLILIRLQKKNAVFVMIQKGTTSTCANKEDFLSQFEHGWYLKFKKGSLEKMKQKSEANLNCTDYTGPVMVGAHATMGTELRRHFIIRYRYGLVVDHVLKVMVGAHATMGTEIRHHIILWHGLVVDHVLKEIVGAHATMGTEIRHRVTAVIMHMDVAVACGRGCHIGVFCLLKKTPQHE
ncbi:Uncharacterized protein Fot_49282 [Forsythia ovata]|uniref:Uncharacterized protein n=1 Tax=Forsythia ovata TaxID=205694 RepID=A0ABD1QFN9_9LAMI